MVVVGGGPGGMKAALTCSERGHHVTLLEKCGQLGGRIKCADYDLHKADLKRYKDYAVRKIENSDVTVMLNTEATPELVRSLAPDALILAMGAEPGIPSDSWNCFPSCHSSGRRISGAGPSWQPCGHHRRRDSGL